MADLLQLKALELDALRETANIGAGHAATALSQMTGDTIMITVPTITIAALEDVPSRIMPDEEPIVAVLMQMMGDLTGTHPARVPASHRGSPRPAHAAPPNRARRRRSASSSSPRSRRRAIF